MTDAIDIGSRLELFVDDHVVDRLSEATRTMHRPVPRDVVMRFDRPWEGNSCNYISVIEDGGVYRMYYRASQVDYTQGKMTNRHAFVCYAESADGVRWERPSLGLVEFEGSKDNNIIWDGLGTTTFAVFLDENPDCDPDARFKAFVAGSPNRMGPPSPRLSRRPAVASTDRRADHHGRRLRLPEPGLLGHRPRRVQGVPPRLPAGTRQRAATPTAATSRPRHPRTFSSGPTRRGWTTRRAASASCTPTRSSPTTGRRTYSWASRRATSTAAGTSRRKNCHRSTTAACAPAATSARAPR